MAKMAFRLRRYPCFLLLLFLISFPIEGEEKRRGKDIWNPQFLKQLLVLDDKQVKKISSINEKFISNAKKHQENLVQEQNELVVLLSSFSSSSNLGKIKAKLSLICKTKTKIRLLPLERRVGVEKILTTPQKRKFRYFLEKSASQSEVFRLGGVTGQFSVNFEPYLQRTLEKERRRGYKPDSVEGHHLSCCLDHSRSLCSLPAVFSSERKGRTNRTAVWNCT